MDLIPDDDTKAFFERLRAIPAWAASSFTCVGGRI